MNLKISLFLVFFATISLTMSSCTKKVCDNSCSDAYDGYCDDGGPGSSYSICECGTDCFDCGERTKRVGPGPGGGCN